MLRAFEMRCRQEQHRHLRVLWRDKEGVSKCIATPANTLLVHALA